VLIGIGRICVAHPPAGGRGDGQRAAGPERAAGIGRREAPPCSWARAAPVRAAPLAMARVQERDGRWRIVEEARAPARAACRARTYESRTSSASRLGRGHRVGRRAPSRRMKALDLDSISSPIASAIRPHGGPGGGRRAAELGTGIRLHGAPAMHPAPPAILSF